MTNNDNNNCDGLIVKGVQSAALLIHKQTGNTFDVVVLVASQFNVYFLGNIGHDVPHKQNQQKN